MLEELGTLKGRQIIGFKGAEKKVKGKKEEVGAGIMGGRGLT